MTRIGLKTCVLSAFAAGVLAQSASATVIMSDNFSRTTGNPDPLAGTLDSDWGSNDNGGGGTVVQTYATTPDRPAPAPGRQQQITNGSQGILQFGATATTYDLYTNPVVAANKQFSVEFDFTRYIAGGFVGVFFGNGDDGTGENVSTVNTQAAFAPINRTLIDGYAQTVEAAFLFQNNADAGRVQKFSYGVQDGGNFDNAYDDATAGTIGTHRARIDVSTLTSFTVGQTATFALSIDGNAVTSVTAVLDGGLGTFGFTSNQGPGSLQTATLGPIIDNLVVTSVPEPASILLAGLGGLAMLRRSRA